MEYYNITKLWIIISYIERGFLLTLTLLFLAWIAFHSAHSNFTTRAGMTAGSGPIIIFALLIDLHFQAYLVRVLKLIK